MLKDITTIEISKINHIKEDNEQVEGIINFIDNGIDRCITDIPIIAQDKLVASRLEYSCLE